jgi:hypothetical protein
VASSDVGSVRELRKPQPRTANEVACELNPGRVGERVFTVVRATPPFSDLVTLFDASGFP